MLTETEFSLVLSEKKKAAEEELKQKRHEEGMKRAKEYIGKVLLSFVSKFISLSVVKQYK